MFAIVHNLPLLSNTLNDSVVWCVKSVWRNSSAGKTEVYRPWGLGFKPGCWQLSMWFFKYSTSPVFFLFCHFAWNVIAMSPLQGFGVKKWRRECFSIAQMVERRHKEPKAAGSIPATDSNNSCASKMYRVTTVCFLWLIVHNFPLSWNWLFFSSSAKNSCSDWTVQSTSDFWPLMFRWAATLHYLISRCLLSL